jgi:hypothetical protein
LSIIRFLLVRDQVDCDPQSDLSQFLLRRELTVNFQGDYSRMIDRLHCQPRVRTLYEAISLYGRNAEAGQNIQVPPKSHRYSTMNWRIINTILITVVKTPPPICALEATITAFPHSDERAASPPILHMMRVVVRSLRSDSLTP